MSQAGEYFDESNYPQIPTQFDTDSGSAVPLANVLEILGTIAVAGTSPLSTSGSGNTVTVTTQLSQALAAADATKVGLCNFDSSMFAVDVDGFVTLAGSTTAIDSISPNSGTDPVVPDGAGLVTIVGSGSITTVGSLNTLTAQLTGLTDHAVQVGAGTDTLTQLTVATDGQVLLGATGADPAFATLTSTGSTIDFTLGANTLNLETTASIATSYTTDSGSAVPALGVLTVSGGNNCTTSGSGSTVTIDIDTNVADSFPTDSGTATPSSGALTVAGGTLLNSSGAGSTVTLNADDSVAASVGSDSGTATPASNAFSIVGTGGITTSGATSVITIDGSAISDFDWNVETGTSASMAVNNGYVSNNAGLVTFTLPATAAVGDKLKVSGLGAGGWAIAQNASQLINMVASSTTTGAGGSLASTDQFDAVELVCVVANTTFNVLSSMGNITVV